MIKRKYLIASKVLVLALLIFCFPCQSLAYNKSWDQGHQCVNPTGGDSGWGKYDYDGVFHGGYTSKECCELYCKICPVYAYTGQLQKTFVDLTVPGVGPSLAINRTYLSQDFATSLLGRGWMFNFGKRLIITRNKAGDRVVGVRQETGEKNFFKEYPDGTLELLSDYGVTYQITKNPGGSYTILNADDSTHNLDSDGKIISIVDKNGNTLSFEYSEVGCLSRITNASGNYIDFQMGPNGKIASISDNFDRTVSYTYDTAGSLTASTDPMEESTLYAYDSKKRLTQITDPRGNTVISVTYDTHQPSRIATFTEKGETWTIAYHPEANPAYTTKKDSSNHTWTYYANDVGIIEKVVDPSGHFKQEQQHNKVTSTSMDWEEDGKHNRTTYTYDEFGNIASKTDALSHTWTYTYVPGTYRMVTETSPLNVVTKYEYNASGNQTKVIKDFGGALANTTTYTYDSLGRKTSVTDPLGHETTYAYDDDGNLLTITDHLDNVITYTYDGRGNKLTETNANGHTTTYTYDLMNRLLTVTDALNHATTYTYNENGNKISETNANENTTTYTYDAYNRLTQVTDPLSHTTSYTYDSKDNRTSMTDAGSHATTYTYNSLNQLTCVTDALSKQTNYTYDLAGNVLTITDAGGKTTTFTYDAANRISSETNVANEAISYTYDAEGKRLTAALPNGNTIATTYDRLGRVSSVSDTLGLIRSYTYYATRDRKRCDGQYYYLFLRRGQQAHRTNRPYE